MATVTETIYAGRDNVFSLQLIRGGVPINLLSITGYELVLSEEDPEIRFVDLDVSSGMFTEKANGIVEIAIGEEMTEDQTGRYRSYLITYDPSNPQGVRWPFFYLKVV